MPRVHFVKKARKADKAAGIKKGDSYFWWKFRYGGMRKSKVRPRSSQLTQSEYLSTMYAAQETIEDALSDLTTAWDDDGADREALREELAGVCESVRDDVESAGSDCDEKLNNMPDSLQQGSTGELLQQRVDACETMRDSLDEAATNVWDYEGDSVEEIVAFIEAIEWEIE